MNNIYMDESGSVHRVCGTLNRFFIIGIIVPNDIKKLNRLYKLFVRKNYEELKKIDKDNKMFNQKGKFLELKGSCFNKKMKQNFIDFFCRNDIFKVGYIILDNNKLQEKFISNKARTFNYLLKLFFINNIQKENISDKSVFLHIDERNVRTESRYSLEDYLNQELCLNLDLLNEIKVKYYDSSNNNLIQVADVFSNIMYSNLITRGAYQNEINYLIEKGYILPYFLFPPQNKKKK